MEVVCHTRLLSLPHRTCLGVNLIQPEGKLDADTGFLHTIEKAKRLPCQGEA